MESSLQPEYIGGVAVFRPSYEDFKNFRLFVKSIEHIGMQTGIVKVIPPVEWINQLPKIPTAVVDRIEIKNPITQNITINGGRGIFGIDNIEKRRKFTIEQWADECERLNNQPPAKRGEKQRPLGKYNAVQGEFVSYDDSDFHDPETLADLASKYWKGLAYGGSPMYGADLLGSLFDERTTEWNVAKLDSLLNVIPDRVPGVTDAYLYCGMWRATFAWHLEDVDLPSINYIHFGAPKQWYSIPQAYHDQFYDLMSSIWPDEQEQCSEFLRHKTFLVDPTFIAKQGIPVNKIVHYQNEFIITFPYGYHAGFNFGFNIAESVNFATESWLDIGIKAKKCTCVSHSVGIDVEQLIDLVNHPEKATQIRKQKETQPSARIPPQNKPPKRKPPRTTAANVATMTNGSHISPPITPIANTSVIDASVPQGKKNTQALQHAYTIKDTPSFQLGRCVLCPNIYNGEYCTNPARTLLAHIVCVNLTPETRFSAENTVLGLDDVVYERFELKCAHCKIKHGSCFQCSLPKCTRAYHGSCAAAAGVDYENTAAPFCRFHRKDTEPANAKYALPGDIVQYKVGKNYYAGVVEDNDLDNSLLLLKTMPNPDQIVTTSYETVVSIFDEIPEQRSNDELTRDGSDTLLTSRSKKTKCEPRDEVEPRNRDISANENILETGVKPEISKPPEITDKYRADIKSETGAQSDGTVQQERGVQQAGEVQKKNGAQQEEYEVQQHSENHQESEPRQEVKEETTNI